MNSPSIASPDSADASLFPMLFIPAATASTFRSCATPTFRTKREALAARHTPFLRRRHRPADYRPCACTRCRGWHLSFVRSAADET